MKQQVKSNHGTDAAGNPAGGMTTGLGIHISWQHGPLGRGEERIPPNGAFVEGVIQAAVDRIEFYQRSAFRCEENAAALGCLYDALGHLAARTADREDRGVEGTRSNGELMPCNKGKKPKKGRKPKRRY